MFESYLNYVLFVVIVLCYNVMNMKYFRYIGIIDEYVKKRAEKIDSATIMKMNLRELPVPLAHAIPIALLKSLASIYFMFFKSTRRSVSTTWCL